VYIHKYSDGGDTFYRISKSSSKPGKAITLTINDWHGKVSESGGNVGRAIEYLKDAPWSVKEEEKEEVKEEKKEEKKESHISHIVSYLDKMASEIQDQDPVVAMAIDKISDIIESSK
jgi:Sec-independent protein translocase protein TatA